MNIKYKKLNKKILALFFVFIFSFSFLTTFADDSVDIDPAKASGSKVSQVYTLLAPIGEMATFDTTNIGAYFNMLFRLAIGLCASLAVVMIVVGGIQYMGAESIFAKTAGKDRIFAAILGLMIALGSWVILNTINPDLTGSGGLNISQVSGDIDEETVPWAIYEVGTTSPATCPEGFEDITISYLAAPYNKINICKSIGPQLVELINAAYNFDANHSIKLFGYGSRSTESQILKRKQNCGVSNVYNKSAICKPKTAVPGGSNHEKGLAIDFTCNGKGMGESGGLSSPCYKWLKINAGKYGLQNNYAATKESWHWSTNGR